MSADDFIAGLSSIHQRIEADLNEQGLGGGELRCEVCGETRPLVEGDAGHYLRHGWPKHCGYTMRWWTRRQLDTGADA